MFIQTQTNILIMNEITKSSISMEINNARFKNMNIINFIVNFVFITNFTSGFKLTYCDPENMIHFSFFMSFSHLPRKSQYQRRFLFSKPRNKNKIVSCCKG